MQVCALGAARRREAAAAAAAAVRALQPIRADEEDEAKYNPRTSAAPRSGLCSTIGPERE